MRSLILSQWRDLRIDVTREDLGAKDGSSFTAIYGSNKSKMATTAMLEKFQVAISPQPVVRSTSCFVLGWSFRGRRI